MKRPKINMTFSNQNTNFANISAKDFIALLLKTAGTIINVKKFRGAG